MSRDSSKLEGETTMRKGCLGEEMVERKGGWGLKRGVKEERMTLFEREKDDGAKARKVGDMLLDDASELRVKMRSGRSFEWQEEEREAVGNFVYQRGARLRAIAYTNTIQ